MPGVVTSRTRRRYERPPEGPFAVNYDSPLAVGLVAWWPLNRPGRTAFNVVGQRSLYDLELTGTLAQVGGPDGGLAYTCSSSQYFQLPDGTVPATTVPLTLGCWFNPNATNVTYCLMSLVSGGGYDGYMLQADGGSLYGGVFVLARVPGTSVATSGGAFAARRWQHALGVFASSSSRTAYLNGSPGATNTDAGSAPTADRFSLGIDGLGGTYGNPLAGLLADCCVWSRALSDAEARRLYDPGTRWELYYPLGRRTYSFALPAAAPSAAYFPVRRRFRPLLRM